MQHEAKAILNSIIRYISHSYSQDKNATYLGQMCEELFLIKVLSKYL